MPKKLLPPTRPPATANELPVGRIAGLFGIRGELKCDPTSAGRAVFSAGARLLLDTGESVTIESVREHKGRLLVRLEQAVDATSAQRFVGLTLFAPREELDVEPGEYLDIDLVGCDVVGANAKRYGRVQRVEHYPASDMLVVGGRLLPMVRAFIRSIDLEKKEIVVDDLPEGLLEGEPLG
ncbi:MAG TPA: ribosome maturation factor RimM [Candidatus Acidoferrales bacterium]|nr:ribosome maturation factor RimM [Candidatus Acidoferrales bacterium]